MTPDDLIQELRDVHLPQGPQEAAPLAFAIEPLLVLAVAVLLVMALALWRRHAWRLQLNARLRQIDAMASPEEQWAQLLDLVGRTRRIARLGPPPDCVYRPRERIGTTEVAALRHYISGASRA